MIAFISGFVLAFRKDSVIVHATGVGYQVFTTASTLAGLAVSPLVVGFWTHQHVREDSITLFGFETLVELEGFQALLGVRGLGPRNALKAIGSASIAEIVKMSQSGDIDGLCQLEGIGARIAEAMCEEVKKWAKGL